MLENIWARRVLALVRIGIGVYFGQEAVRKIAHGWLTSGSDFAHSVRAYPGAHGSGFYHAFVTGTILPHARLFALLVALGECSAAVSLTFGLLTRAGALVALWLNANFVLLRGFTSPSGTLDKVFVVLEILILVTAAGRTWGLDELLGPRLSQFPILAWLSGTDHAAGST